MINNISNMNNLIQFLLFMFRVNCESQKQHSTNTINYFTGKEKHKDNKHKARLGNNRLENYIFSLHNKEKHNDNNNEKSNNKNNNWIQFFIFYVPSQQLEGQ
jgi:hypothetical protein